MRIFSKWAKRRDAVIDLRRLACPACGGRNTEIGWMDRVARASGHWCDDCGHSWRTLDVDPETVKPAPPPRKNALQF